MVLTWVKAKLRNIFLLLPSSDPCGPMRKPKCSLTWVTTNKNFLTVLPEAFSSSERHSEGGADAPSLIATGWRLFSVALTLAALCCATSAIQLALIYGLPTVCYYRDGFRSLLPDPSGLESLPGRNVLMILCQSPKGEMCRSGEQSCLSGTVDSVPVTGVLLLTGPNRVALKYGKTVSENNYSDTGKIASSDFFSSNKNDFPVE